MKVPFLDLKKNYSSIRSEIQTAVSEVLESTGYVLGPKVSDFESRFAQAHAFKHCIGVSSGTDANHLALWVLGIGPGDEVILPANTFIATAWGATLCGATPVFVDCEKESYNIAPEKISAAITKRTKAVVGVHLYGQPCDVDSIKQICQDRNIAFVEDAAQAHNSEYKGKKIGGLGITSSFSFYPGKNLGAYGEGGAVGTNDDLLARKVKMFRDHGSEKKYYHEYYGHNYRMEAIQGAILGVKLSHLNDWTAKRRAAAAAYWDRLSGIGDLILPKEMPYATHVYHLYVIQTSRRDALKDHLTSLEIGVGLHYPVPLHLQQCFSSLGYSKGDMPNTELLAEQGLSLPMFPELTIEQIEYVCDSIKGFFQRS